MIVVHFSNWFSFCKFISDISIFHLAKSLSWNELYGTVCHFGIQFLLKCLWKTRFLLKCLWKHFSPTCSYISSYTLHVYDECIYTMNVFYKYSWIYDTNSSIPDIFDVTMFVHSWNICSSSTLSTPRELSLTASRNFLTVACLPSLFLQAISIWNICVWTLKLWFILIWSICALVNPRLTPSSSKSAPMCLLTNNNSLSVGGLSVVWTAARTKMKKKYQHV